MEQIGFIGFYDKKDILLNISKIYSCIGKRTLVVDATMMQRMRYIVPNGQIAQYLGTNQLNYDFIIIDSDNIQTMYSFMIPSMKKIFYVTSYDKFEVEKSKELFENINKPLQLTKVIISSNLNANEDKYLVHTLENNLIKFDRKVEVLFEDTDRNRAATLQSQLVQNISFKNYTSTYKDSLEYLAALIAEGMVSQSEIKSVIKKY